jgi:Arginine/lysine/ornithine decarboxylases
MSTEVPFNALIISGAIPVYVNPGVNKQLGIPLGMSVAEVKSYQGKSGGQGNFR